MTGDHTTEIPLSKAKLLKLLVFSIFALCAGLWIVITNPQLSNPIFGDPIFEGIAGYGGIIVGVLGTVGLSIKLLDNSPGLIIDPDGIYENCSIYTFGLIQWDDIEEVYEETVNVGIAQSAQRFVTVVLTNPGVYIARERNPLKRGMMKLNAKHYGSPVHISASTLKIQHAELLQLLREQNHKYNGNMFLHVAKS